MGARIVVATDTTRGSAGAIRLARTLARGEGTEVHVVTVVPPFALHGMGAPYPFVGGAPDLDAERAQGALDDARTQIRSLLGEITGWTVRVELGATAPMVIRVAEEVGAELLLVGLGHHSPADRWLRTETSLDLIRLAHIPVLAAHPNATGRPRRALVAMDFSRYSLDAATTAMDILAPDGELHLAHVAWEAPTGEADWLKTYSRGVHARLDETRSRLQTRRSVRLSAHVRRGDPVRELLSLARELDVDLIAAGTHGYGFFSRIVMGSVSTRLLRGAECSVLVAPPRVVPEELTGSTTEAGGTSWGAI